MMGDWSQLDTVAVIRQEGREGLNQELVTCWIEGVRKRTLFLTLWKSGQCPRHQGLKGMIRF